MAKISNSKSVILTLLIAICLVNIQQVVSKTGEEWRSRVIY